MDHNDVSIINFTGLKNRPIAVSLGTICSVLAMMGALAYPFFIEKLSADFVTKAEFVVVNTKLDTLIRKDVRKDAYDTISNIEGDIKRHNKLQNGSQEWVDREQQLSKQLGTAIAHKDCVQLNQPNCEDIKDEIWQ